MSKIYDFLKEYGCFFCEAGGNYSAGFIFQVFLNAVKKSVRSGVGTVFLALEMAEAYNVEQYILLGQR